MLVLQNCRFLCTPKTGSTWITRALKRSCTVTIEKSGRGGHHTRRAEDGCELPTLSFVRHPLTWYPSYWNHRIRTGWWQDKEIELHEPPSHFRLDQYCHSDKFSSFMNNVVELCPGFLSRYYPAWVGTEEDPVEFVGRFECLVEDLCEALRFFNEPFNESALRSTPPFNVSDYRKYDIDWTDELAERVVISENKVVYRFYGDCNEKS